MLGSWVRAPEGAQQRRQSEMTAFFCFGAPLVVYYPPPTPSCEGDLLMRAQGSNPACPLSRGFGGCKQKPAGRTSARAPEGAQQRRQSEMTAFFVMSILGGEQNMIDAPFANHRRIYTALSLYLSSVKCRVLRELVLSNCVK